MVEQVEILGYFLCVFSLFPASPLMPVYTLPSFFAFLLGAFLSQALGQ